MKKIALFFLAVGLCLMAMVSCEKPREAENNDGFEESGEIDDPIPPVGIIAQCSTNEASLVTEESARLHGTAVISGNDYDVPVSAYFYYSATSGDARALKAEGQKVEAGNMPSAGGDFEADLSSLLPSTTYYFVAVVSIGELEEFGAVMSFTTEEPEPTGPRAIDLGIVISRGDGTAYKLLWADYNLGATAPEEGGDYYAWGETDYYYQDGNRFTNPTATWQFKDGKSSGYEFSSYIWAGSADQTVSKYCPSDQADRWGGSDSPDGKTVLEPEDDAARAVLGEGWRMPTAKEFEALAWWCNHEWTTQGGAYGMKVTSTVNGQSIFLPAVGYRSANSVWDNDEGMGYKGYYWISSINSKDALYASMAYLNNETSERCFLPKMATDFDRYQRYWGMQVRAVKEEETQPITSTHMGHEFVDMGNGIKMATKNIGADYVDHPGERFAWGEVRPKSEYTKNTYRYYSDGFITRYKAGYKGETITLYPEDDAAHANWGGSWRIPTSAEWQTLLDKNKYQWEWDGGDFLVTCRENNNSVFIPAAGVMSGKTLMNVGSSASYWSNSLSGNDNESNEYISCLSGSYISGFTPNVTMAASSRYLGFPIRPVCDL